MHSEPAIENRATERGRRRDRGNGPAAGPVFVDNSGRRSKLLRRIGLLAGVLCLGYAVVLGLAFMGIGTATPSSLLPFAGGGPAGARNSGPRGTEPQGGFGTPPARPTGTPPTGAVTGAPTGAPTGEPPSSVPSASASTSPSAAASAPAAG
ncbi:MULTISPECIES: hypothetical protein [Streptomyces]|uniref:Bi-functional transferase/deacetylase n=1 Tax=Streptomyces spinosisporus TaxID=2927582 RepID=A0ABS9XTT8_9ACTN|nr:MULTISPECIES: hypothetical protein [Streptomyces]MCI3245450.1 hypothetical protein [Streptomyces spinosisporus]WUB37636.1 hypothetical protein OHN38_23055 [Streptomyces sp. NBC_00588]